MFETFNLRQLQAYAGVCLQLFCNYYNLDDVRLKKLAYQLVSVLKAKNLVQWESDCSQLEIPGRGEPLPQDLQNFLIEKDIKDLYSLIDACVEVGLVNMYGKQDDKPLFFMKKCTQILTNHNIELPPLTLLESFKRGDNWGEEVNGAEFKKFLEKINCLK